MTLYHAPKCGTELITLGGLSVTDNGFGAWNSTFPVSRRVKAGKDGECEGAKAETKANGAVVEIIEELGIVKT